MYKRQGRDERIAKGRQKGHDDAYRGKFGEGLIEVVGAVGKFAGRHINSAMMTADLGMMGVSGAKAIKDKRQAKKAQED